MSKMKAVCIESFGGPETLQVQRIEQPEPAEDEVLIRVRAASVNPVDYKIRSGRYPAVKEQDLPRILGRDVSGVVAAVGAGVTQFHKGDEIFAMLDRGTGGYAEYVTIKADLCAPKPATLGYAEAAAVPLAAITAWQGLFDYGRLEPGQRVLIHGGAGGVGHFAIQLAKARGAQVSTTVSGKDKEFVRALGADQVIDYRSERFEDLVSEVDLGFDLVGGDTQESSWAVLKEGGALVSTLAKPSDARAQAHHVRATNYLAQPDAGELEEIGDLIDDGKVHPVVKATYPLEEAAMAQSALEREHLSGKVVLQVSG